MALDNIPIDTITQSGKDEDGRKKLLEAMLYDIFSEERIASAHKRTFSYQEMEKKVEMVCSIIKENIDKNDIRDLVEGSLVKVADDLLMKDISTNIVNKEWFMKRRFWRNGLMYMIQKAGQLQSVYKDHHPTLFSDKRRWFSSDIPRYKKFIEDHALLEYLRQQDNNDIVSTIANHIMEGGHLLDGRLTDDHPDSSHVAESRDRTE